MSSDSKMLFKASNVYLVFILSLLLSIANTIIISRFVLAPNNCCFKVLIILLIIFSYYFLLHVAFRITYFGYSKIEINYPLRVFNRKKSVIYYNDITKAFIYTDPLRESPFLRIWLKGKRFPINIKYLDAEKIEVLKKMFNEKQIKFKTYTN